MNQAPKRRWFRFSLWTLFVVVTVFGCWLGYELNRNRQRQAFVERAGAVVDYPFQKEDVRPWLMTRYSMIRLPSRSTAEDIEEARRLFPEAEILAD